MRHAKIHFLFMLRMNVLFQYDRRATMHFLSPISASLSVSPSDRFDNFLLWISFTSSIFIASQDVLESLLAWDVCTKLVLTPLYVRDLKIVSVYIVTSSVFDKRWLVQYRVAVCTDTWN